MNKNYDIDYILSLVQFRKAIIEIDGFTVGIGSDKLQNFVVNGTDCVCCQSKGLFFRIEKDVAGYHFLELYCHDYKKNLVKMTCDHKILKSEGGINKTSNYSTMCDDCNFLRGSKYPILDDFIKKYRSGKIKKRFRRPVDEQQRHKANIQKRKDKTKLLNDTCYSHVPLYYINRKNVET